MWGRWQHSSFRKNWNFAKHISLHLAFLFHDTSSESVSIKSNSFFLMTAQYPMVCMYPKCPATCSLRGCGPVSCVWPLHTCFSQCHDVTHTFKDSIHICATLPPRLQFLLSCGLSYILILLLLWDAHPAVRGLGQKTHVFTCNKCCQIASLSSKVKKLHFHWQ